jgi:hypothetical protein
MIGGVLYRAAAFESGGLQFPFQVPTPLIDRTKLVHPTVNTHGAMVKRNSSLAATKAFCSDSFLRKMAN